MQKTKIQKFISLMLGFLLVACGDVIDQDTSFRSLAEPSVETPDFQQALESVVETDSEKIGRRTNKKGEAIVVEVGGKDLGPEPEPEESLILEVEVHKAETPKVDILFYVGGETQKCLQGFAQEVRKNGFLAHLDRLDWNLGLSLSPTHPKIIEMENNGRKLRVWNGWKKAFKHIPFFGISKSDLKIQKAEQVFLDTITTKERTTDASDQSISYDPTRTLDERRQLPSADFMDGLDAILSHSVTTEKSKSPFVRQGSQLYVIVIDYDHFPYYKKSEWKDFYKKYPMLNIVLLSSRRVSVSNFDHLLKSPRFNFHWIPKCNRHGVSNDLVQLLLQ